jgi:hypothetical protein
MQDFINALTDLSKAVHNDEQGKYRRVAGKTVFIRSDDKKVTKGPDRLKGKKMVMKTDVSTADFTDQVGSPSSEVLLTDGMKRRKKGSYQGEPVVKSLHAQVDSLTEIFTSFPVLDIESDVAETLEKAASSPTHSIGGRNGVWRRVAGRKCFICDEGKVRVGPPSFIDKSVHSLADELRAERANSKG